MELQTNLWYYNKQSDMFLYCAELLGTKTVQTYSRVPEEELMMYSPNNDEMQMKDLPPMMLRGYRPFGKLRGRGYLQKYSGKYVLIIPRTEKFKEQVKEMLWKAFDENMFRKLVYDFPDMLVDTYKETRKN